MSGGKIMRTEVIDQAQQKENNLSIVLRRLMTDTDCTRVKLAAQTGLAQATVTKIVSLLMTWGIVTEQESIGSGVGRRAVRLRLQGEKFTVAAVRINRDNICAVLMDMNRKTSAVSSCEISFEEGPEKSVEKLKQMLQRLICASDIPVCAIGVAVPGPFSCRTGRISLMSGYPGWNRIDIRETLEKTFRVPVFVEHDANCGAVSEYWNRSAVGGENLLFVAADMGIGAGMILDSRLYRGKDGFAGEIGHSSIRHDGMLCECGNRGCLELYASTVALERQYKQATGLALEAEKILKLVRAGEAEAECIYRNTVVALACGLVSVIHIINPDAILFAGRLTEGGQLFLKTVKEVLQQRLMREQMENMTLGISQQPVDPMLLGAGIVAFQNMLEKPSVYFGTKKK